MMTTKRKINWNVLLELLIRLFWGALETATFCSIAYWLGFDPLAGLVPQLLIFHLAHLYAKEKLEHDLQETRAVIDEYADFFKFVAEQEKEQSFDQEENRTKS